MLLTNNSCLIPLELLLKSVPDTISKLLSAFWGMSVLPHNSFDLIFFHTGLKKHFEYFLAIELCQNRCSQFRSLDFSLFLQKFQKTSETCLLKNVVGKQNVSITVLVSMKAHSTTFYEFCKPFKSFAWNQELTSRKHLNLCDTNRTSSSKGNAKIHMEKEKKLSQQIIVKWKLVITK